jgi:hypothetical protein
MKIVNQNIDTKTSELLQKANAAVMQVEPETQI